MFHQGDVQSGISLALQNGKSVVCFVTDNSSESVLWETEWLKEGAVATVLSSDAVVLRIESGSEAAQQLSAVYAIQEPPTLLVVNKGKLDVQLHKGVGKDEFTQELLAGLRSAQQSGLASSHEHNDGAAGQTPARNSTGDSAPSSTSPLTSETPPSSANQNQPQASSSLSATSSTASDASRDSQRESHVQRLSRQKREANQERERVRALIEADKRERKAREEQRRRDTHEQALQAQQEHTELLAKRNKDIRPEKPGSSCSLQIRLLDGSTLRHKFEVTDTLRGQVRQWIDQNRIDGDTPYTFKLILTPQPSRSLDDSHEKQSLADLDLLPSASLVLVPVKNFSEAYRASGSRAFLRGIPVLLYGYLISLFYMLFNMIRRLTGMDREDQPSRTSEANQGSSQAANSEPNRDEGKETTADNSRIRIKTLRDQQDGAREDEQLYNGNTLNFEPDLKKTNDEED